MQWVDFSEQGNIVHEEYMLSCSFQSFGFGSIDSIEHCGCLGNKEQEKGRQTKFAKGIMRNWEAIYCYLKKSMNEFKKSLGNIYETTSRGLQETLYVLDVVSHSSLQISCMDSCIEDLEGKIRELMLDVVELKEGMNKLLKMNQCNHCQESPYGIIIGSPTSVWIARKARIVV